MEINHLPLTDLENLEPGCCCPEFDPAQWDGLDLHFRDKTFVHAATRNFFHIPLNIGSVFGRTWNAIKEAHADDAECVILSEDKAFWHGDHYFSVSKPVPGQDNVTLNGDYLTHVFEGPYRDAPKWVKEMEEIVTQSKHRMGHLYFYYTTCPKCATKRGKNYVVGVAELKDRAVAL